MKKIMLMAALMAAMTQAHAQKVVEETDLKETEETAVPTTADDGGMKRSPSTGDLFDGLTRPITFDRMIPPYALEVTFYKTVHIIFPATIKVRGTWVPPISSRARRTARKTCAPG